MLYKALSCCPVVRDAGTATARAAEDIQASICRSRELQIDVSHHSMAGIVCVGAAMAQLAVGT